jgi:hypothetical protein
MYMIYADTKLYITSSSNSLIISIKLKAASILLQYFTVYQNINKSNIYFQQLSYIILEPSTKWRWWISYPEFCGFAIVALQTVRN